MWVLVTAFILLSVVFSLVIGAAAQHASNKNRWIEACYEDIAVSRGDPLWWKGAEYCEAAWEARPR